MAKKVNFDAEVTFGHDQITIDHNNKDLSETKDWSWIKSIQSTKNAIWFTVNALPPIVLTMSKDKLTQEEIDFFESKKQ